MLCYLLSLPFTVSAFEMEPPLDRLLAVEPTGRYVGDTDVLGKHIHAVMTYNDADGTMDFQLSGVLSVDCPGEPFTMSDGEVMLTDVENDSDCIKSTLKGNHCTLKYIDYDASSDELTVKVDYHWLGVHVHLSKVPTPTLTASGACMDAADQKLWNGDGRATFSADLSKCGHKCWGGADCTSKCIKEDFGYTTSCSGCFGELTGCTKHHCMWDCSHDASGPKCKNCVDEHCTPAFKSCSGLTPPSQTAEEHANDHLAAPQFAAF